MVKLNDISNFVKSERLLIVFLVIGFGLIVYLFISFSHSQKPTGQISWKDNIVAGQTTKQDVEKTLGKPLKTEATGSSNIYYYPTQNKFRQDQIIFSKDTTQIIKEQVIGNEKGKLADYVTKYGQPQAIIYGQHGFAAPGHFWQQEGLLVFANDHDGTIVEIWYFAPTTLNQLLKANPQLSISPPKNL